MENMLILENKNHIVFLAPGEEKRAKDMRMTDPRLKYARIYEGIQAYPSQVEHYKVYDRRTR